MKAHSVKGAAIGKNVKVVFWPSVPDDVQTLHAFNQYLKSMPGYKPGAVHEDNLKVGGKDQMTPLGQEAELPFSYAGRESITVGELFPFKGTEEQKEQLTRVSRMVSMGLDCFLFSGSPLDRTTNNRISEFTSPYEDKQLGCPIIYLAAKSQLAQARQDMQSLIAHDRKVLVVSSLPEKVVPSEMEQLLKIIINVAGGNISAKEIDLSAKAVVSSITVLRGKDLMVADVTGKSDPFCKIYLGQKFGAALTDIHTTKVKKQTLCPVWTEKDKNVVKGWDFAGKHAGDTLFIEIWDEDTVGADRMGFVSIPVAELTLGELELKVKAVKKEKACGTLYLRID